VTGTSRRGFFRSLAGELARAGGEVLGGPAEDDARTPPPAEAVVPDVRPPIAVTDAPPPTSVVGLEELLEQATRLGLGRRHEALREFARTSRRLVADASPAATSAVGGAPGFPAAESWPVRDGRRLAAIAAFDRSAWPDAPVAGDERLYLFAAAAPTGDAPGPVDCGPLVAIAARPDPAASGGAARAVIACPELVLPRVWTAAIQALDLDDDETGAWEALRTWAAEAQGTVLGDGPGVLGIDRVLGYPDERRGAMPERCESATGVPRERWRLLLQLTDRDGRWGGRERLYAWAPDGDPSRARVIAQ
jgi:hypothetical protein